MRNLFSLVVCVLLTSLAAFGQGARYDNFAFSTSSLQGSTVVIPLPGSQITVCASPGTGGTPCTNKATIYTNQALTVAASNPLTADAQGNFGFWAPGGKAYDYYICTTASCAGPYTITPAVANGYPRYADQFAGADWVAKINAACSDIGSGNAGVIVVPTSLASSGTATTALDLSHCSNATAGGVTLIFGSGTYNISGQALVWTAPNSAMFGQGRNNTVIRQNSFGSGVIVLNNGASGVAKVTMGDFSIRYASQASVGVIALQLDDVSQSTFRNISIDQNAAICIKGESLTASPGLYDNHFSNIVCQGATDGVELIGTAALPALQNVFDNLEISGLSGKGLRIFDYVQGADFSHYVSTITGQNLSCESTSNLRTFDLFFSNGSEFDAPTASNPSISCDNVQDFRCNDCWVGAGAHVAGTNTVQLGAGMKNCTFSGYIGGQDSGAARLADVQLDGNSCKLDKVFILRGAVAPSTASINLSASSQNSAFSNITFVGHALGTEYVNSGTNNTVGNYVNLGNIGTFFGSPIRSTVTTGTAPLVVASTTPVANLTASDTCYNHSGTQITNCHSVIDFCTLGTDCAVTLAGLAVFTNSSSYQCTNADATGTNAVRANQTAGNGVTFTGTGTDVVRYICKGN